MGLSVCELLLNILCISTCLLIGRFDRLHMQACVICSPVEVNRLSSLHWNDFIGLINIRIVKESESQSQVSIDRVDHLGNTLYPLTRPPQPPLAFVMASRPYQAVPGSLSPRGERTTETFLSCIQFLQRTSRDSKQSGVQEYQSPRCTSVLTLSQWRSRLNFQTLIKSL